MVETEVSSECCGLFFLVDIFDIKRTQLIKKLRYFLQKSGISAFPFYIEGTLESNIIFSYHYMVSFTAKK